MRKDSRPVTSETLASMLMTNPLVVRRTMALLRQAGYVSAIKGHNGGCLLATPLTDIILFDIH
ncbi:Rrf2 family transcriptional regulator [Pseudoalteromonas sp. OFAV1]|uniref:Rrf2 family transcriptional regulator n=1 Tax=Pseudoalteromonas sp. OFAV1 TaxID=2908892 RepID=UPI001F46B9BA|nr:Rrf2 family transcriptional regulator [Pseudoalteromonas sp. OFAV1]MCF2901973.1 Rrf2 family transcriptional regulator [Pseudoalteromonas sp. OFAV1]